MKIVVAIALGLLAPMAAIAQESVFNLPAFAVPEEGTSVRMRALGGAGSGLPGDVFSLANPAPLGRFRRAGLTVSLLAQETSVEGDDGSGDFSDVMFPLAQVVVPAWHNSVIALGYYQFVDFDTDLEATVEFQGESLPVQLESTGGVPVLAPAIAYALDPSTQLGASLDVYLGSREIVRVVDVGNVRTGAAGLGAAAIADASSGLAGVGAGNGIITGVPGMRASSAGSHSPTSGRRYVAGVSSVKTSPAIGVIGDMLGSPARQCGPPTAVAARQAASQRRVFDQ